MTLSFLLGDNDIAVALILSLMRPLIAHVLTPKCLPLCHFAKHGVIYMSFSVINVRLSIHPFVDFSSQMFEISPTGQVVGCACNLWNFLHIHLHVVGKQSTVEIRLFQKMVPSA